LTFEQAQAYCRWLSQQTGEQYRLPTEEEASVLYEDRDKDGENTLDHWAGYKVNPDDARRLQDQLKELEGRAPLLREVGQFKGEGADRTLDGGGNAAEGVQAGKGMGKAMGGCAATPADDRAGMTSPPEYVGFRVIKVKP